MIFLLSSEWFRFTAASNGWVIIIPMQITCRALLLCVCVLIDVNWSTASDQIIEIALSRLPRRFECRRKLNYRRKRIRWHFRHERILFFNLVCGLLTFLNLAHFRRHVTAIFISNMAGNSAAIIIISILLRNLNVEPFLCRPFRSGSLVKCDSPFYAWFCEAAIFLNLVSSHLVHVMNNSAFMCSWSVNVNNLRIVTRQLIKWRLKRPKRNESFFCSPKRKFHATLCLEQTKTKLQKV